MHLCGVGAPQQVNIGPSKANKLDMLKISTQIFGEKMSINVGSRAGKPHL